MQAITWIDRIADESNLWLNAVKHEDQDDLAQAVALYLRDASDCLARKSPAKAALGCSCAADCLLRLRLYGDARALFREAGLAYLEAAESTKSVRELLWCFKESWIHFQAAGDKEMAEGVLRRFSTLSRRVDPFPAESGLISNRRSVSELEIDDHGPRSGNPELDLEVEHFLSARRLGKYEQFEPSRHITTRPKGARTQSNEKSIINQLG
jgi:hypothetical protein